MNEQVRDVVKIRPATAADIPSMMRLDQQNPTAAHWTEQQYAQVFHSPGGAERFALVAETDAKSASAEPASHLNSSESNTPEFCSPLAGFLIAQHIAPDWELENIVVSSDLRHKGIAARLLNALVSLARETNSQSVFLEVRESNIAARSFYEKAGFHPTGHRKSYYAGPSEDAVLYRLNLE